MAHPRDILLSLKASARKSLSQNFLTSPHWADALTGRVTQGKEADEYWEIGPGLGALTRVLLQKTKRPIRVFEYDRKLSAYLKDELPGITIVEGDFLKVDLSSVSPEKKKIAVLSNLPYHLSSPILFKLVDMKPRLLRLVMTFQKEFADRLLAQPKTSAYGSLSIISQLHFKMESLGVLPPGAFFPAPAVASEALLFEPKPGDMIEIALIAKVVKAAFAHRRKKVINNLKNEFKDFSWEALFDQLDISVNTRAEEISKEKYLLISSYLK